MREQKANDNGFPVVGKQVKEQQTFPFDQLVQYDGATNKITINANLTINGDTNIGELDIDSGDAPKGQVLTADGESGASWGFPSMERIVDLDDNFRFIEGTIEPPETIPIGINFSYNKWSLSGTHLMLVIEGSIDNGVTTPSGLFAEVKNIPDWVLNKISPIFNKFIEIKTYVLRGSNLSGQTIEFQLVKEPTGELHIYTNSITLTLQRFFKIQFDLLIDAE